MKVWVEMAAMSSPSDKATALLGSVNLKVNKHSPVATSQSLVELSNDAVINRSESTASAYSCQMAKGAIAQALHTCKDKLDGLNAAIFLFYVLNRQMIRTPLTSRLIQNYLLHQQQPR